jgi:hypothetical protein
MNFAFGLVLIALTVTMVMLARPQDGAPASVLRVWIVGQLYLMVALASAVGGVALLISGWPA